MSLNFYLLIFKCMLRLGLKIDILWARLDLLLLFNRSVHPSPLGQPAAHESSDFNTLGTFYTFKSY